MASTKYRWLAEYYDHLYEFRRPFTAARRHILEPVMPGVKTACDLACGTGTYALELAARGIRTYAVDLSPDMCRLARAKARRARSRIRVIEADMRTFRLPEAVDLVSCEFDAINHVPSRRDLPRVFRAVARALRRGGYFAFDLNNRLAFEQIWPQNWFIDKDPVAIVVHGDHRPGSNRAWSDVEIFIRKGKTWTRHYDRVEEVCWSAGEVEEALAAAGFEDIRAWDAAPFFNDQFTPPGNRTFWRARKQGQPDSR